MELPPKEYLDVLQPKRKILWREGEDADTKGSPGWCGLREGLLVEGLAVEEGDFSSETQSWKDDDC